jgi:hypothetical protein
MDKEEMIFQALSSAMARGDFTDAEGRAFPATSDLSEMVRAGEQRLYRDSYGHPLRNLVAFRNASAFMRGESLPYPEDVFAPAEKGPDGASVPFAG